MPSLFLTGTDTGVGKTHAAVGILRLLKAEGIRCVGMKPICCGDRADAESLLAVSSEGATLDEINPIWLKTPAAPLIAAEIEGVRINRGLLLERLRNLQERFDYVLVEGVGGWLVPIEADYFVADLAGEMQLPIAVVALNRLGCLNHTLLTVRNILASGGRCAGIVLNTPARAQDVAEETNRRILERIAGVPVVAWPVDGVGFASPEWRRLIGLARDPSVSDATEVSAS